MKRTRVNGVPSAMRANKSIAAAMAVGAIIMMLRPRVSMAQANPPAGAAAPTTSNASPSASGAVAHPHHHKKKRSFMQRVKGKLEKTVHRGSASKKTTTPKKNGPAKSAGQSPSQIE